jgi:hypothetical protein
MGKIKPALVTVQSSKTVDEPDDKKTSLMNVGVVLDPKGGSSTQNSRRTNAAADGGRDPGFAEFIVYQYLRRQNYCGL